ncbi:deoxyribose-phosphate aldolase [Dictyocaulus viviparus]|uniref:Alpha-1,3/1,6-mannosyltransferase ALG2 n=2 Tax=Dictyocaulus viviparus TaxID=29172 RepID=A0A0D8X862_DICVI|nr:deoxyribose-phosphate aldolase [Dictyocaulus viviparus]
MATIIPTLFSFVKKSMHEFNQEEFDKEVSRDFDTQEITSAIARYETEAAVLANDKEQIRKLITYIDLTTLAGDDTRSKVIALTDQALAPIDGDPSTSCAAVCVYPQRVSDIVNHLAKINKKITIAAVAAGFPSGQYHLQSKLLEVELTVADGAKEIDIVISRAAALEDDWETVYNEVSALKTACGSAHLKTILATGDLKTLSNVYKASWASILAGSNFIKTSTGKETTNATLEVAFVMCAAIKRWHKITGKKVGFKPAGGIKTLQEGLSYVALVKEILGTEWLTPNLFRIGASSLLSNCIGGAERLIIDAALALQKKGHQVRVVTNQFDSSHAFKETQNLNITIVKWFPRVIFGYMWALCAYIRMCLAAIYVTMFMKNDVIICDQVSAALIVLRLFSRSRLVFYCHFPDVLLTNRNSVLKSFYRFFLDAIEEYSTGLADVICVNSLYTASVVKQTFSTLRNRELKVLYPTLNTEFFDAVNEGELSDTLLTPDHVFTSLNRFEVKKNVKLALEAFAELRMMLPENEFSCCHLVIAGGYDRLNNENIAYYQELVDYVDVLGLNNSQVTFLRSPSDEQKISLLRRSRAVLYTPNNEHFGIVPIEAMYVGTPVIAVDSGGPRESIIHGQTGFLAKQTPQEFAMYMLTLIRDENLRLKIQ